MRGFENLPCQVHVPEEGDKCHFHDGGGGPGPVKITTSIFTASKSALDAICYLHAASDAVPFAIELAKNGLGIFGKLVGMPKLDSLALSQFYDTNRNEIVRRLSTMDERELREFVAVSNHLVALVQNNEGEKLPVYVAAY